MPVNILITSASRKVDLVRAFQAALAASGGGTVIPVDTSPLAAALYESPVRFLVPPSQDASFIPVLLDLCRARRVGLLVPTRDEELPVFARSKDLFETAGTTVMVCAPQTVDLCQDKLAFVQFCLREGFSVPRVLLPEDLGVDSALFPVFVRDRRGKGSTKAYKVDSSHRLADVLAVFSSPLIQEFIAEPEYTVDLFSDFSGTVVSVVPRNRLGIFGGESFIGRTFHHDRMIGECSRLAERLGLIGHNTIQCFFAGREVRFIEVNPRFGGGAALGFAAGAPTPEFLVRLSRGLPVEPCIGRFERGLVMLRYTQDRFLREEDLTSFPGGSAEIRTS